MRWADTLRLRLLVGAVVWIILVLVIAGWIIADLFQTHLRQRFEAELANHLERSIELPEETGRIHIAAADQAELSRVTRAFNLALSLSLGVLATALIVAALIQVQVGLRPLSHGPHAIIPRNRRPLRVTILRIGAVGISMDPDVPGTSTIRGEVLRRCSRRESRNRRRSASSKEVGHCGRTRLTAAIASAMKRHGRRCFTVDGCAHGGRAGDSRFCSIASLHDRPPIAQGEGWRVHVTFSIRRSSCPESDRSMNRFGGEDAALLFWSAFSTGGRYVQEPPPQAPAQVSRCVILGQ